MKNYSVFTCFGDQFEVPAHDLEMAHAVAGYTVSREGQDGDSIRYIQPIPTVNDIEQQAIERLIGNHKHFCPDWDGMAIDETCTEFEACRCGLA